MAVSRPLPRVVALPAMPVPVWRRGERWLSDRHGVKRVELVGLLGGAVAAMVLAGLGWLVIPARYSAEARLQLNVPAAVNATAIDRQQTATLPAEAKADPAALHSELDVLTSRPLARAALAGSGQAQAPQDVDAFLERLDVALVPGSETVLVRLDDRDPQRATAAVNALVATYLARQRAAQLETTQAAGRWLDGRLQELRQHVSAAELAVVRYRGSHKLTTAASGLTLGDQQLSDLSSQLLLARAEEAADEAKVAAARSHGAGTSRAVLDSPLIQQLHEQESLARKDVAEKAARYGAKYPALIEARQELAAVQQKIAEETAKQKASLGTDVAAAHARAAALAGQLAALQVGAGMHSADAVELAELERQAQASRLLYEGFLARSRELAQPVFYQPPARVIALAEVPRRPGGPSLGLVLALAAVVGGLGGLALARVQRVAGAATL